MITTILITLAVTVVIASMYWQPSFGSGSYHEPEPRRTPLERYIDKVTDLLWKAQYDAARTLLEKPEYPLAELPLASWIKMLNRNKNIIVADLQSSEKAIEEARKSTKQQLRAIEGLEIILGSS